MTLKLTAACSILLVSFTSLCTAASSQEQGVPAAKLLGSDSAVAHQALNTQGIVRANSIEQHDGVIRLVSRPRGLASTASNEIGLEKDRALTSVSP